MNLKPHIVSNLAFFVSHAKGVALEILRDMTLPYPERNRPSKSHGLMTTIFGSGPLNNL